MMSEEKDMLVRLVKAETLVIELRSEVNMLKADFNSRINKVQDNAKIEFAKVNEKLDVIYAKISEGKGAWWAFSKLTAVTIALIGLALTLLTIFDKLF